jgi:glycosyltransferase involved in cell wall biosynthesis
MREKIETVVNGVENPPPIYLLFGELTNSEMNELYNHPKIKAMVSITKGEGFGRPLLEFTMTGKPVIASNWSGHKDFLPVEKAIMIGGELTDVHDSAVDNFILKGSKWFTADYNEFSAAMRIVKDDYNKFLIQAGELRLYNAEEFSLEKMKDRLKEILTPFIYKPMTQTSIVLPKIKKIN